MTQDEFMHLTSLYFQRREEFTGALWRERAGRTMNANAMTFAVAGGRLARRPLGRYERERLSDRVGRAQFVYWLP